MNRFITLFSALLFIFPALGQEKGAFITDKKQTDKDAPAEKYHRVNTELVSSRDRITLPLPVRRIEVLDVRQDTSKFGYFGTGSMVSPFRQYCFTNTIASDITTYLNQSCELSSREPDQSLLYCIKKFWITNTDTTDENQHTFETYSSRLYLRAELYLQRAGLCYPLYRFDSIFSYHKNANVATVKNIKDVLAVSLLKLGDLKMEKVWGRKTIPRNEIDGYYADQNNAPVLSTSSPARGVYMSIADFKNNRPAYTDYEVSFEKLVDIMRVKEADGSYSVTKKDWGYCDGEHFYMRIGQNYFRLFRAGQTFELNGSELVDVHDPDKVFVPASPYAATSPMNYQTIPGNPNKSKRLKLGRLKPLQLDLETGRVY